MASLQTIRDAIRTTLNGISDLHVYDTVPEASNLPAAVVMPDTANFNVAMGRGMDTWEFDIAVLVSWGESGVAQDRLDAYVTGAGARSIRQAIFSNRNLGLADTDAHISRMSDYGGQFDMAGIDNIGARLRLVVHTKGTE
ncbi:hypothetical protein [Actinomadura alba]|uniref:DUF3168 domain-containing protein n=1 Tax=Actinomadura alba TaxID=406431 RepID=A0ABR7LHJ1_9ACTN|nr:hypothetical protein [Actinomadura alba]MBC6464258.1 hypothetical protein [Actinomadura alba]